MKDYHKFNDIKACYTALLQSGDIEQNSGQEKAVEELANLQKALYRYQKWSFFRKLMKPPKGLYIWGDVGRGKTFLMDLFYDTLPHQRKLRLHFHRFMHRVHMALKDLENTKDPLQKVAKQFAREAQVLCFDEFFVSDITDAMILGKLLEYLLDYGVILVATSNVLPDDLYKNGLQRQQFLPAIALLNCYLYTHYLESDIDYRLRVLQQAALYYTPLDEQAHQQLMETFTAIAPEPGTANQDLVVLERTLSTVLIADDVVWFEFDELCGGPRSHIDYIELAKCFHSVCISNVPQLTQRDEANARRFIAAIDEFYDRNVKVVITAAVPLEELYVGSLLAFEFQRTVSRLTEMQSQQFLGQPHKP